MKLEKTTQDHMLHPQKGGEVEEPYPAATNHSYGSALRLG